MSIYDIINERRTGTDERDLIIGLTGHEVDLKEPKLRVYGIKFIDHASDSGIFLAGYRIYQYLTGMG